MALGEAKAKAKIEFAKVVEDTGYSIEDLRAYQRVNREVQRPLYKIPHYDGVVGTGARFAKHIGERMAAEGIAPGLADRQGSASVAAE